MRRIGLGFTDDDPQRARLHRETVDALNEAAGIVVEVTTPAAADTEFAVRHPELGHVAREVHILMADAPGFIYRSRPGAWTKDVSFLKYSAAGGHRLTLRLR